MIISQFYQLSVMCFIHLVSPMLTTLNSIHIVLALALVALILLQRPSSDASGIPVGGESGSFLHTRRGAERFFFVLTVSVSILFAGVSLAVIVLA